MTKIAPILIITSFLFLPFFWKENKSVEMEVTAYCPCKKCCGKFSDGITASGVAIDATRRLGGDGEPVSVNGGKFVAG